MFALPVLDLGGVTEDADLAADRAARLDAACRRHGVVQLVHHGVPDALVDELFAVTRAFFDQPDAVKARVAQPEPDQVRGWSAHGREGLAYSLDEESPADLKEKFDIGPVTAVGDAAYRDPARSGPHLAGNRWPEQPAGFRAAWESYYRHMDRLGRTLVMLAGLAWGMPADWPQTSFGRQISMLRALHYPRQRETPLSGQLRAGAHSDYGAFTISTAEDGPGGLQILDRSGEWTTVPTSPGRLLAWSGDLLAEWTADEWPATLHRVTNPQRSVAADSTRLAFAFYQEPDHDAHVDILPPFRSRDWTPQEPVLTAGEHLRRKYVRQTTFGRWRGDRSR